MRIPAFLLLSLLGLAFCTEPASAEVRLPGVFGDHMVLQRDGPLHVWGWATPGEDVAVTLATHRVATKADAGGRWRVELPALPAGGPHELTVRGTTTLRLTDVLIGEVWLCSGQSNMAWPVQSSARAREEIAAAGDSQIRHLKIPQRPAGTPLEDVTTTWEVCSPDTAGSFTACGYFLARTLRKKLGVPIGLVNASWGGTRIEPWIAPAGLRAVPSLAGLAAEAAAAAGAKPGSHQQTCVLYNGMVHALIGFPIRGAIWYQGESNHREGALYTDKMEALIAGWRSLWGQGDFPFYFVQIAPYRYGNEAPEILPAFWEAQAAVLERVPHTGMAVINDIATVENIHPPNKQDVGDRLARLALKRTYGVDVVDSGPTFQELHIEGDTLRIEFKHAKGLRARDGAPLTHFEIAGAETGFVPATARIEGTTVLLSSKAVRAPLAMRFAWHKLAEPNLTNGTGLPAGAFRAGEIPRPDFLATIDDARGYSLVYDLDLAHLSASPRYTVDKSAEIEQPFDRVAYLLELQPAGDSAQYLWLSMDAFTDAAPRLGIPTAASGTTFQQAVSNLHVRTNVAGIETGQGFAGTLEFWACNYGPGNVAQVPGASGTLWDFGDQPAGPGAGYGCMQVHRPTMKQTLFAINHWTSGGTGADIGIGNSRLDPRTRDWTFAANGGTWLHKRLRVFVHPK